MGNDSDIDRFVKDPNLLIELCRKVIDRMDSGTVDPKNGEKEAQLREIAKAVEKLEKMGVPVPDALRAEKTRLAAGLGIQAQAEQALQHLSDELAAILKSINTRLGRGSDPPTAKKPRVKRSRSPKTNKDVLRKYIIQALKNLGGRARVSDVIEEMGRQLESKLLPGDMEWRDSTREYVWQNNAKWERYKMTQDGTLRSDSPRGYWELGEGQQ
jgi:exonuclease VII small subunit